MPAKVAQVSGVTTLSIVKISDPSIAATLDNVVNEVATNEAKSSRNDNVLQVFDPSQSFISQFSPKVKLSRPLEVAVPEVIEQCCPIMLDVIRLLISIRQLSITIESSISPRENET